MINPMRFCLGSGRFGKVFQLGASRMFGSLLLSSVASTLLVGQTFTVLESFETVEEATIETVVAEWTAARSRYSIFTAGSRGDRGQVTDGAKSLQISLTEPLNSWGEDFQVILSADASSRLKDAFESLDPHRYWILYDMTFAEASTGWANNPFWIGTDIRATHGDQLEFNGTFDEPVTAVISLDSVKNGQDLVADESGRIRLGFGFNSNSEDSGHMWIDHIRLLDTYAPGFRPTETLLDGYEDEAESILVPSGAEVFPYDREGSDDPNVTEGNVSARVEINSGNTTTTSILDFTLSDDLSNLLFEKFPEERLNHILAFDYRVVPDPATSVSWFLLIPQAGGLRLSPTWADGASRTYSINLGLVDWEQSPQISLITQGGFDGFVDLYIDNIRLIDTQGELLPPGTEAPSPAAPSIRPEIQSIVTSADSVTLTFSSQPNVTYEILASESIATIRSQWEKVGTVQGDTGTTSRWSLSAPVLDKQFFIIQTE